MEGQLLWDLRQRHTESNSKKLLAGLRLSETFHWVPATVTPAYWLFIDAFERVAARKQEGKRNQWAGMECIRQPCTVATTPEHWELAPYGLEASEAFTAAPDGDALRFKYTKGRVGMHYQTMGP